MLPTSRNTTYSEGDPIKFDDLNDMQDKIVDEYGRWSAKQTWTLNVSGRLVISGTWGVTTSGAPNGNGKLTESTASGECLVGLLLPVGGKLDGYTVRCQDGGATALVGLNIQGWDDTGNAFLSTSTQPSKGSTAKQTLTQTGLNHTITAGRYYLRIFSTGAGAGTRTIWHASVAFYMPL